MGFDAEIDNSERNGAVDNLQEEIICSICHAILEVIKLTKVETKEFL